ncbi:YrhB domain-containing protein [Flavobacterium dankookense]|uniref:Immunity protein 35 of polymorphic toxin system n=1 Tax=Flavobacterium dankookense TaxID=706186 RepID=A0A4R6QCT5_9FLAO|nr:YrhB domain-containing protein [Flavobacterium dankookense]TDP60090.1 immunity protein 35 of polymorphic toxin system [Flavobacterium dankookense]
MLTEKEITEVANKFIREIEEEAKMELLILQKHIIKKPYGIIYFYTSKKYYETKDDKYAVAGNAPFLVEKETGNIVEFGTGASEEYYILEYEAGRWPIK